MKTLQFLLCVLFTFFYVIVASGQSDQENMDKYWSYRDRLRKNFLKVGNLDGEGIPMTLRRIDWAFQNQNESPWPDASAVYFSDATIYLGHYLMLLATEYSLSENALQEAAFGTEQYISLSAQKEQTLTELYYAIATVNRLDKRAEAYLTQGANIESNDDINGFFLRDDVPKNFYTNFLSDYSEIFDQGCDFQFTDSDWYAFPEYPQDASDGTANDIPLDQMQNIPNEAERTFNAGNYMSLDQITTIFTGLRCVFDLVDPVVVQPIAPDTPMNLREEKGLISSVF